MSLDSIFAISIILFSAFSVWILIEGTEAFSYLGQRLLVSLGLPVFIHYGLGIHFLICLAVGICMSLFCFKTELQNFRKKNQTS